MKKELFKLKCQHCDFIVERANKNTAPTCFECKRIRINSRSKTKRSRSKTKRALTS
jgi:hypothetical protein